MYNATLEEIDVFARTLYGEAAPGKDKDVKAIACVIMNRAASGKYGKGIVGVCKKPKQFSCWNPGDVNLHRIINADQNNAWFKTCQTTAKYYSGAASDITNGALHYHTRAIKPKWSKGKTPCYESEAHFFFNDIDAPKPKHAVKLAITGAAASGGAVALDQVITQAAPTFPLLGQIVQHAPLVFGFITTVAVIFIAYKLFKEKKQ